MIPMNHKSSFPWRAFLKSVAAIAVPVALQNLLTTTGSMIDTVMLASLGKETVGGVGLCAQFSSLMFSGYWGFVGGGILFMSQYFGAKDDDGVNRAYGLTLSCMMVVGLIFMTLAVAFPGAVMRITPISRSFRSPARNIWRSSALLIRFRFSRWRCAHFCARRGACAFRCSARLRPWRRTRS